MKGFLSISSLSGMRKAILDNFVIGGGKSNYAFVVSKICSLTSSVTDTFIHNVIAASKHGRGFLACPSSSAFASSASAANCARPYSNCSNFSILNNQKIITMNKKLLKMMLVALMAIFGGQNSWGKIVTEEYDFLTWGQNNMTKNSYATINRGETSLFKVEETDLYPVQSIIGKSESNNWKFSVERLAFSSAVTYRWGKGNNDKPRIGNENTKNNCYISIVNLKKGDKVVFYTISNFSFVSSNVKTDGEAVISGTTVTADKEYEIQENGHIDIKCAASTWANIQKISVIRDVSCEVPTITLTKINGKERTYTITYQDGETLHYRLPGKTEYTEVSTGNSIEITTSTSGELAAYTTIESSQSDEVTETVDASIVELNTPTLALGLAENNGFFNPTIASSSIDNKNILFSPTATMKYSFTPLDGAEEDVNELPYTISKEGTFKAVASAEGYGSSTTTYTFSNVLYQKVKNKTINFTTISEDNLIDELGDTWAVDANTNRWSMWSKTGGKNSDLTANGGGTYYKAKSATDTQKDYLEIPSSCYLLFGYGVGVNNSNNRSVTFTIEGIKDYLVQFIGAGPSAVEEVVEMTSDKYEYNGIKNSNVLNTVNIYIPMIEKTATIGDAGYATYVTAANTTVPAGITAYTVTTADNKVELHEIASDAVIKSGTAILLKATKGNYNFTTSVEDVTELPSNALVPATTDVTATGNEYALTKQDGKVGFAQVEAGVVIPAGKAYLVVDNSDESAAKFFSFDNGEVTGINNVNTVDADNNAYYTLQGLKTQKPVKGMYIHNGKKVILK